MKINNIVSFGCSWPHGVELEDRADAYPAIIADHYGWELDDRTKVHTTLQEMLADFADWLLNASLGDQMQSLVLINLTREDEISSVSELPSKVSHDILVDPSADAEHSVFEWVVSEFDRLAEEHRIPLLQFNVLAKQHRLKFPTLIESSSALEMLVIRDKPRKDPLFTEHKFPNEKGHKIISEFLINKIDSVILNE